MANVLIAETLLTTVSVLLLLILLLFSVTNSVLFETLARTKKSTVLLVVLYVSHVFYIKVSKWERKINGYKEHAKELHTIFSQQLCCLWPMHDCPLTSCSA